MVVGTSPLGAEKPFLPLVLLVGWRRVGSPAQVSCLSSDLVRVPWQAARSPGPQSPVQNGRWGSLPSFPFCRMSAMLRLYHGPTSMGFGTRNAVMPSGTPRVKRSALPLCSCFHPGSGAFAFPWEIVFAPSGCSPAAVVMDSMATSGVVTTKSVTAG